jgi:hypothetical protein
MHKLLLSLNSKLFLRLSVFALLLAAFALTNSAHAVYVIPDIGLDWDEIVAAIGLAFGTAFAAMLGFKIAVKVAKSVAGLIGWGTK